MQKKKEMEKTWTDNQKKFDSRIKDWEKEKETEFKKIYEKKKRKVLADNQRKTLIEEEHDIIVQEVNSQIYYMSKNEIKKRKEKAVIRN